MDTFDEARQAREAAREVIALLGELERIAKNIQNKVAFDQAEAVFRRDGLRQVRAMLLNAKDIMEAP